ncbi:8-oxo-dGTP pyrophosphatase MutT (NUDIX family) [Streptacidiphilus sp. BW17]|uniref:NUDIX domain-containing protein n=1 Tax=Streptacidiphilus sp. BW17 TaxID=3156274 RepID=UPI0035118E1F
MTDPEPGPVREATASALLLHRSHGQWLVGLILHPRYGVWMASGGHIESAEPPSDAVLREVREETGLRVRLIPGPALLAPAGWPHPSEPAPWLTASVRVDPDSHTAEPHIHIDHMYLAVATDVHEGLGEQGEADHPLGWFGAARLQTTPGIGPDFRALALDVLHRLGTCTASDPEALAAHLADSTAPEPAGDGAPAGSCER